MKPTLLDRSAHQNIKIKTGHGIGTDEAVQFAPVTAPELRALVGDYPLFLLKNPDTGQFGLFAQFGFTARENLFLTKTGWDAAYIPLSIRCQPFIVSAPEAPSKGSKTAREAPIAIDMDSPRINASEGENLFLDDGANAPYLNDMIAQVTRFMSGMEATRAFIDALSSRALITPSPMSFTLPSGERKTLEGFYNIHEARLKDLADSDVLTWHKNGFLQAAHLVLASTANLKKLALRTA